MSLTRKVRKQNLFSGRREMSNSECGEGRADTLQTKVLLLCEMGSTEQNQTWANTPIYCISYLVPYNTPHLVASFLEMKQICYSQKPKSIHQQISSFFIFKINYKNQRSKNYDGIWLITSKKP